MINAKLTGMLQSRIDHDDRLGLSTQGRHGEELGRARHAANVADSTGQEYSNASSRPAARTTGTSTDHHKCGLVHRAHELHR